MKPKSPFVRMEWCLVNSFVVFRSMCSEFLNAGFRLKSPQPKVKIFNQFFRSLKPFYFEFLITSFINFLDVNVKYSQKIEELLPDWGVMASW